MAKTKISEYSATSADNTDISNINIAEGCSPANVNNAIRTLMAQLKDLQAGTSGDTIPPTAGGLGVASLTGLLYGNGASAATAATATQVATVISTATITNSTNATNATNATRITNSGGWNVTPNATNLIFSYNGTNVAQLDSSGNLTVIANVTSYGTL
jgi:hypothetical protein